MPRSSPATCRMSAYCNCANSGTSQPAGGAALAPRARRLGADDGGPRLSPLLRRGAGGRAGRERGDLGRRIARTDRPGRRFRAGQFRRRARRSRRGQPGDRRGDVFRQRPARARPRPRAGGRPAAGSAAGRDRRAAFWRQCGLGFGAGRRPAGRHAVLCDRRLRSRCPAVTAGSAARRAKSPRCAAPTICAA